MSRRTRRHHETPFSLFSFQDIIAAVTGVVLLLTLLLMLELILRHPNTAEAATPAPAIDEVELRARLERARQQLLTTPAPTSETELARARQAIASMEKLLGVLQQQAAAATAQTQGLAADLQRQRQELDALAAQTAELRRQAELERATTRVTLLGGDRAGMMTWFVECAAEDVRVGRIDDDGAAMMVHRFNDAYGALQWALTQPRELERFVLLVRPGGVGAFDALQAPLRAAGYSVGWDLWTEPERLLTPPRAEEGADAAAQ